MKGCNSVWFTSVRPLGPATEKVGGQQADDPRFGHYQPDRRWARR